MSYPHGRTRDSGILIAYMSYIFLSSKGNYSNGNVYIDGDYWHGIDNFKFGFVKENIIDAKKMIKGLPYRIDISGQRITKSLYITDSAPYLIDSNGNITEFPNPNNSSFNVMKVCSSEGVNDDIYIPDTPISDPITPTPSPTSFIDIF